MENRVPRCRERMQRTVSCPAFFTRRFFTRLAISSQFRITDDALMGAMFTGELTTPRDRNEEISVGGRALQKGPRATVP